VHELPGVGVLIRAEEGLFLAWWANGKAILSRAAPIPDAYSACTTSQGQGC
jgi:hypothetical protein